MIEHDEIYFWAHMLDECIHENVRTYVPDEWHGIKKLVTVGDFLDVIANIYSGQQNAYVCFAPERDSGAKIFGQVNRAFEESESNGKHCIMTLAPYKNGSRIQDCSIDGMTSRPLHLSEIAKMMSNMDENSVLFVRYTDPQAYGPKAGQIIEQMIDEITFDQRYGIFLRPREDLAPTVVAKGSDSLFN